MVSNEAYGVGVLASEMPRKSDLKEGILSVGFYMYIFNAVVFLRRCKRYQAQPQRQFTDKIQFLK